MFADLTSRSKSGIRQASLMRAALFVFVVAVTPLPMVVGQDMVPPQPDMVGLTVTGPMVLYAHLAAPLGFALSPQLPEERPLDSAAALGNVACRETVGPGERTRHTIEGYVVDGPVDYSGEHVRASGDGGLYSDLVIGNGTLVWYFAFNEVVDGVAAPAAASNVVLRATVYGSRTSGSTTADEAQLLAQVETAPATLVREQVVGGDGTLFVAGNVAGQTVFGARLPLPQMVWPELGVALVIELDYDAPCANGAPAPSPFTWHASEGFWPRLDLSAHQQLGLVYLTMPVPVGSAIAFRASVWSPWGRWDVAEPVATVEGPGKVILERNDPEYRDISCCGPEARDFSFLWRDGGNATPGTYTFTFQDANQQGTAKLVGTVTFEITPRKDAPAVPLAILGTALVLLAVVRRRL